MSMGTQDKSFALLTLILLYYNDRRNLDHGRFLLGGVIACGSWIEEVWLCDDDWRMQRIFIARNSKRPSIQGNLW